IASITPVVKISNLDPIDDNSYSSSHFLEFSISGSGSESWGKMDSLVVEETIACAEIRHSYTTLLGKIKNEMEFKLVEKKNRAESGIWGEKMKELL
ncbi:hypothetical protein HAX54_040328, partial [Datura stramonium]|nr:hypothetical protein [Datura stramonium]